MTPDFDTYLTRKYPKIFGPNQMFGFGFGFECGDGWYQLINKLCERLMTTQDPPLAVQVKEKFGALRFYVLNATDQQYGMIAEAEHASRGICEVCGAAGTLDVSQSWVKTLCEGHMETRKK